MTPTPSHRLKLHRAEKHLSDLKAVVADAGRRREYPVREAFDTDSQEWVYTLDLAAAHPPELFPIVLGDFLFNVRSALDHLVVAIAPDRDSKRQVEFPIFTADPLKIHEHTGAYLHPEEAGKWNKRTTGLPADCIAELRALQPYKTARHFKRRPADQALALLSVLQNADKHRYLVGVVTGLRQIQIEAEGDCYGLTGGLKDGAEIHTAPAKVDVKVEGAAQVSVGWRDEVRDFDRLCETILDFTALEVLPRLEPFLPGGTRAAHHAAPPSG
jgi:hypothetical protein